MGESIVWGIGFVLMGGIYVLIMVVHRKEKKRREEVIENIKRTAPRVKITPGGRIQFLPPEG